MQVDSTWITSVVIDMDWEHFSVAIIEVHKPKKQSSIKASENNVKSYISSRKSAVIFKIVQVIAQVEITLH